MNLQCSIPLSPSCGALLPQWFSPALKLQRNEPAEVRHVHRSIGLENYPFQLLRKRTNHHRSPAGRRNEVTGAVPVILHPWDISGPYRPKGLVGPALSVEDQIPNEQHVLVTILGLGDFAPVHFWVMSSCSYGRSACSVVTLRWSV